MVIYLSGLLHHILVLRDLKVNRIFMALNCRSGTPILKRRKLVLENQSELNQALVSSELIYFSFLLGSSRQLLEIERETDVGPVITCQSFSHQSWLRIIRQIQYQGVRAVCHFYYHKDRSLLMKLYFVFLMKSHLQSYPCPLQINSFSSISCF